MSDYNKIKNQQYETKIRELCEQMPKYVTNYLNDASTRLLPSTRHSYAVTIFHFFNWLCENNSDIEKPTDISLNILSKIRRTDIIEYLGYSKLYTDRNGQRRETTECGYAKKLSTIRGLYNFLIESGDYPEVKANPAAHVKTKLRKKEVITMERDEIQKILEYLLKREIHLMKSNSQHELKYCRKTKYRDIAIFILFLGTGLRVSELCSINIYDINLSYRSIYIKRKGAKEQYVYFNSTVENALRLYIDTERKQIEEKAKDKSPLFYSLQKKRISEKAVENLVKKITKDTKINKKITAHKLRSTYATNLYESTGDIYMVKDALGHENLATVQRYAKNSDKKRKKASENADWI